MIQSAEDLKNYFWFCGLQKGEHKMNVSTKTRKEFLLEDPRGMVTVNCGRVVEVQWKNLGGGVWQALVVVP